MSALAMWVLAPHMKTTDHLPDWTYPYWETEEQQAESIEKLEAFKKQYLENGSKLNSSNLGAGPSGHDGSV
jgi:hypothetical protein